MTDILEQSLFSFAAAAMVDHKYKLVRTIRRDGRENEGGNWGWDKKDRL